MSVLRQIAMVIRSYFANASDKIDQIAAQEAAREAAARRKALEEVKELETSGPALRRESPIAPTHTQTAQQTQLAADYRLLGLSVGAELTTVEDAWRRLASRADPKRFPAGSDEEKRAGEILKSINEAYERIREAMNPTEGRFGQLEL